MTGGDKQDCIAIAPETALPYAYPVEQHDAGVLNQ